MPVPGDLQVRPPEAAEPEWLAEWLRRSWGGPTLVSRGRAYDATGLPALLALAAGRIVGAAVYRLAVDEGELLALEAFQRRQGIGTALLAAVAERARRHGCRRLALVTTNDNLGAARFYRRRGLQLVAVHRGAVDAARDIKPAIPLVGRQGIPIHDELEFALDLSRPPPPTGAEGAVTPGGAPP